MDNTLTICQTRLFDDAPELERDLPKMMVDKILRIRALYTFCNNFPSKKDPDIIKQHIAQYKIGRSAAYEDLRLCRQLLGSMNKVSKDYLRWRYNCMWSDLYEKAKAAGNLIVMEKALANYGKNNLLSVEDTEETDWSSVSIQSFKPTTDPSVLGVKPLPDIQTRMAKLNEKYKQEIQNSAVTIDPIEFNPEDIFEHRPNEGPMKKEQSF